MQRSTIAATTAMARSAPQNKCRLTHTGSYRNGSSSVGDSSSRATMSTGLLASWCKQPQISQPSFARLRRMASWSSTSLTSHCQRRNEQKLQKLQHWTRCCYRALDEVQLQSTPQPVVLLQSTPKTMMAMTNRQTINDKVQIQSTLQPVVLLQSTPKTMMAMTNRQTIREKP